MCVFVAKVNSHVGLGMRLLHEICLRGYFPLLYLLLCGYLPYTQPIPYWLYKLHGLNVTYTCEICGNATYRGPKAFQRHFSVSNCSCVLVVL